MPSRSIPLGWVVTQLDSHRPSDGIQIHSNPALHADAQAECEAIKTHTDGVMKYGVARLWRKDGRTLLELEPAV